MRFLNIYPLVAVFICLFSFNIQAQDFPYIFTAFQEEYVSLENGTSINNGEIWDDPAYGVPIGFEFELFGQPISEIYWNGFLGAIVMGTDYYSYEPGPAMIVYGSDLADRALNTGGPSESPIVFELQGTAPNRIFKVEYQNAGFYNDFPSVSYVNFQLWLYEGSNTIEYRYGDISVTTPVHDYGDAPKIGFFAELDFYNYTIDKFYYLGGSTSNPTVEETDDFYYYYYAGTALDGEPGNGQVYQFSLGAAVNVTFNVDMNKVIADGGTVSPDGVHVAGNFQGWDPAGTLMNDNGDGTWSYTTTVAANQELLYKFINGTTWGEAETSITADCGTDDGYGAFNRSLVVAEDDAETILYCFDYCFDCSAIPTGISELDLENGVSLSPNPASEVIQIEIQLEQASTNLQLTLVNTLGQQLYSQKLGTIQNMLVELSVSDLPAGVYQILLQDGGIQSTKTFIKQ